MKSNIVIVDTTLRDGMQSPILYDSQKYTYTLDEKLELLNANINLGIRYFELFSPGVSEKESSDFRNIRQYIDNNYPKEYGIKLIAHCRCHLQDIQSAIDAGADGLNLYIGLSDSSKLHNTQKSTEEIDKIVYDVIKSTREAYPDIYLRFSGEDAFRTDLDQLIRTYQLVAQYVDTFGMPDTVGIATQRKVSEVVSTLRKTFPAHGLECHFHNDKGLALANTLTAIQSGANLVDTSIWGLAERSGIVSTTALLLNLYTDYQPTEIEKETAIEYFEEKSYIANITLGSILKMQVPFTEPVSLTNRTHIAGVHQKAVLNSRSTYEGIDLGTFGVNRNKIILGGLSGWHAIYYYLKEVQNYDITEHIAKDITIKLKSYTNTFSASNNPEQILQSIVDEYALSKKVLPQKVEDGRLEDLA